MDVPQQAAPSRRPFSDFFTLHAQGQAAGMPGVQAFAEQFQSTRDVDRPAVEQNLNDILDQACDGDVDRFDALRDRAGGPLMLNGLFVSSGRKPELIEPLVLIADIAFDGDTAAMTKLAERLGGMAVLIKVCSAMGGPQALGAVVQKLPLARLLKCSADELVQGNPVATYQEDLVITFCKTPSAENAKPLVGAGLLDAGNVLKIVPVDGKRPGKAFFSVTGHPKLMELCRVESSFEDAEGGPTVKLKSVVLLCGDKLIDLKLGTEVQKALCSPFQLWIALSEHHEAEAGLVSRSRKRLEQVTFDQIDKINVRLAGRPSAYQTKGDLADSAALKPLGLCCFSFSSELSGDLAGVWVLHAHCKETSVDDAGFCTGFEIVAASFKLASQDREVESTSTMKVVAADMAEAGGSKSSGAEAAAMAKFLAQRQVVMDLAHACNPANVIHVWNPEKQRLRKDAPHDTIYDRHNIASPEHDLEGWAATLTKHRILFLFMTKKGLPGHLGQLRAEIGRMTEFAWKADEQTQAAYRRVVEKLKKALLQSATVAAKNAPMREKKWEDFEFEIDIDFGPFGRFMLKRTRDGVKGEDGPGVNDPEAMIKRMSRFATTELFVSLEAFGESMTLLQQDATAISDFFAEHTDPAEVEWRLEVLVAAIDRLFDAIKAAAKGVKFDIPSTTLTFKGIRSLTLSSKGGNLVASLKVLSGKK